MLDAEYRPVWDPELPVLRPKRPRTLKAFVYACARFTARQELNVKDVPGGVQMATPNRAQRRGAKKAAKKKAAR